MDFFLLHLIQLKNKDNIFFYILNIVFKFIKSIKLIKIFQGNYIKKRSILYQYIISKYKRCILHRKEFLFFYRKNS